VIPNIYIVRDEVDSANKISGKELADEIAKSGVEAIFTENFPKTVDWLKANLGKNEIAIVMGAGDVFKISAELLAD
jgi:UDP-N-acetylmuramate-alanine ligase